MRVRRHVVSNVGACAWSGRTYDPYKNRNIFPFRRLSWLAPARQLYGKSSVQTTRLARSRSLIIRSLNIDRSQGQRKQMALSHRMAKERYFLAWKCSERPREDVDGGLTYRLQRPSVRLRARVSEERSSGSQPSVWRPSPTPALTAVFASL